MPAGAENDGTGALRAEHLRACVEIGHVDEAPRRLHPGASRGVKEAAKELVARYLEGPPKTGWKGALAQASLAAGDPELGDRLLTKDGLAPAGSSTP